MAQPELPRELFQLPWWQKTGQLQIVAAGQPIVADPSVLLIVIKTTVDVIGDVRQQLMRLYPSKHRVYLLSSQEPICLDEHVSLSELGQKSWDSAMIVVPPLEKPTAGIHLSNLLGIMSFLRSPEGCPWDREQTHSSLRSNMLEEAQEAVEAIDKGNTEELMDELGDVLLQVVFHAQIAAEQDAFDFDDIILNLSKKLVRRHPHIFGQASAQTPRDVERLWEKVKETEKQE